MLDLEQPRILESGRKLMTDRLEENDLGGCEAPHPRDAEVHAGDDRVVNEHRDAHPPTVGLSENLDVALGIRRGRRLAVHHDHHATGDGLTSDGVVVELVLQRLRAPVGISERSHALPRHRCRLNEKDAAYVGSQSFLDDIERTLRNLLGFSGHRDRVGYLDEQGGPLLRFAKRFLGLLPLGDISEEDADLVRFRRPDGKCADFVVATQSVGNLLEPLGNSGLGDPPVDLVPVRFVRRYQLANGPAEGVVKPRLFLERGVGLQEPVVDRAPLAIENDLDDAEPLVHGLEEPSILLLTLLECLLGLEQTRCIDTDAAGIAAALRIYVRELVVHPDVTLAFEIKRVFD